MPQQLYVQFEIHASAGLWLDTSADPQLVQEVWASRSMLQQLAVQRLLLHTDCQKGTPGT